MSSSIFSLKSCEQEIFPGFGFTQYMHSYDCCLIDLIAAWPRSPNESCLSSACSCEGAGIFGVEMFLMEGGELVLNEVAPRPHNSGHYTIEACSTSQFEQHLRAISGLPLGDSSLKVNNRYTSLQSNSIGCLFGRTEQV